MSNPTGRRALLIVNAFQVAVILWVLAAFGYWLANR